MATTKKQTSRRAPSHALFWTLLKEVPGYDPHYKDVIKEGIVHEHSRGRTQQKKTRYDSQENNARRRVIAAISKWVDKLGYSFESREAKVRYVIGIACRAANCGNFNAIPESRLTAIYNLYCKRNSVDITGNPELDFPILGN